MRVTNSGKPPAEGMEHEGAPQPIDPATGQHKDYWVLSEEERRQGWVRPYRDAYIHTGERPEHPTRPLTEEEKWRHAGFDYVAFEAYPPNPDSALMGRFWTQKQLDSGCGSRTTMGRALSETWARDPSFYGKTMCVKCGAHFPVAEFVWDTKAASGTDEILGS